MVVIRLRAAYTGSMPSIGALCSQAIHLWLDTPIMPAIVVCPDCNTKLQVVCFRRRERSSVAPSARAPSHRPRPSRSQRKKYRLAAKPPTAREYRWWP